MKKYFLMFATFAAALTMMSCNKDEGTTPPPETEDDELKLNLDEALYYGEKLGADAGYYSMTFVVDDTNNKLRLDMFGSAVDPASTPKLSAGSYELGTRETPTAKTYFVATSGTDTEGTLYWNNDTPVLITGGTVNVQSAAGGYTIKLELTAGDETIKAKYSGNISFEDVRVDPPRTPITANAYLAQYTGEYTLATNQVGTLVFLMQDAENTNQQLQLSITIPYPTEGDYPADYVTMPEGTFEVVDNPQEAYQIIPTSNDVAEGTYSAEIVYKSGAISYGVLIQGGTVTITKTGENTYDVTTDLSGTKFSYTSSGKLQLGQEVTDIEWNLTGAQVQYALDMTNPMSSLTENKELTDLTGVFAAPWGVPGTNNKNYIWRIILHNEDLVIDANNPYYNQDGTLYVSGEGDAMMMQLITSSASEFPVGTFNVENTYDYVYPVGNTLSGKPILNVGGADPLGLGVGTWYYYIGPNDEGQMAVLDGAGAVIKQGSINITTSDNKTYNIAVDIFDKYGHNITGTFAVTVDSGQASFSSNDATDSVVRTMPNTSFVPYSFEQHSGLAISF